MPTGRREQAGGRPTGESGREGTSKSGAASANAAGYQSKDGSSTSEGTAASDNLDSYKSDLSCARGPSEVRLARVAGREASGSASRFSRLGLDEPSGRAP
jgi:hypothetical protein